ALKGKRKKVMIGTGSMSDPYLHIEEKLCHTRKALELVYKYGHGATLITKSNMVLRDLDIIKKINSKTKCVIQISLSTSDPDICRIVEPNVCNTQERIEVLNTLRDNGIPTVVWLCPFLPFINDTKENIDKLLDYCIEAKVWGIIFFGVGLTLRDGNRDYFYKKLDESFPGLKNKYISTFGNSYSIKSPNSYYLTKRIRTRCKENNIETNPDICFNYLNTFEEKNPVKESFLPGFDFL
ncbi:MAG: radical SAM protein, partial [Spirochaetales bacterium]|nr:radical SAM protein [Spirochaetales bacterium]